VSQPSPPTRDKLVGAWIGFSEDELDFARLDLNTGSASHFVTISPNDTSLHKYGGFVYEITNWTMTGWKLSFSLTPMNASAEPIYVSGVFNGFSLQLEMGSPSKEWQKKLVLYRESRVEASNKEAKDMINRENIRKPSTSQR